jgi:hypothetical protein
MRPSESLSRRAGSARAAGRVEPAKPGGQGGRSRSAGARDRSHSRARAKTAGRQGPQNITGPGVEAVECSGVAPEGSVMPTRRPPGSFAPTGAEKPAILRVSGSFGFRRHSGSFGLPPRRFPAIWVRSCSGPLGFVRPSRRPLPRPPQGSMHDGNSTPFSPMWLPRSEPFRSSA